MKTLFTPTIAAAAAGNVLLFLWLPRLVAEVLDFARFPIPHSSVLVSTLKAAAHQVSGSLVSIFL